jgi:hypothetical protein
VEFHVCLDFLELGLDDFGAVFGTSKVDKRFLGFFYTVLFKEPAWTKRSAEFNRRESERWLTYQGRKEDQ